MSFCGIIFAGTFKTDQTFLVVCDEILNQTIESEHTVLPRREAGVDVGEGLYMSGKASDYSHSMCALVDLAYTNISDGRNISVTASFELFSKCFDVELEKTLPIPEYCEDIAKFATLQRHRDSDTNAHSACYQCLCDTDTGDVAVAVSGYENAIGAVAGTYCSEWGSYSLFTLVAKYVATVIVTVFNQLIKWVMMKMVTFEKPHNLGEMQASLMLKVFAAQLFNTAVLVVILNSSKDALGILGVVIDYMRPSGRYFDDASNEWYSTVGAAIISAMVIQNFTPPGAQVATGILSNWTRRRKRRATLRKSTGATGGCCAWLDGEPAYTKDELEQVRKCHN